MIDAANLIIHHYALSPFSEKVRAMLGYAGLSWHSVTTREMPPRPLLEPLTGGYRKIPVAQIGADIFCDTRIIGSEIARLSGKPELALPNLDNTVEQFVEETESRIFFASLMCAGGLRLNKKMLTHFSFLDLFRFFKDRISMGRGATVSMPGPKQARTLIHAYLTRLEQQLSDAFLFGPTPCVADFAAYHCLWFIRDVGEQPLIRQYPKVDQWMDRLRAFGHGEVIEIDAETARQAAIDHEPVPISESDQQHPAIGSLVSITPSDYGRVASRGILVGSTPERWIIGRGEAGYGPTHVHFPKKGFDLTRC